MIACDDCGMASEDGTLHTNQCAKIIGPRVPAPVFAVVLLSMLENGLLTGDARPIAKGWLEQYEAWKKGLGG
jgi:hypothetical protein